MKTPVEQFKCQTVLSKNLGPFKEWRKRLSLSKNLKYNVIHFTPIQELGGSNSAYAIRDQLKVNPSFNASLDDIKKEIDFMEKKWSMLSATDIVLNHTADDSPWIRDHPECAYNLQNSPHLRPAFLLDSAFIWLAKDMMSGTLKATDGLSVNIDTELDVQTITVLLKTLYVPALKIYELFSINVEAAVKNYSKLKRAPALEVNFGLYERNNAEVVTIPEHVQSANELRELLHSENLRKRNEIKVLIDHAIDNAVNAIRYERFNPAGPYYHKPLSEDKPLVAPYFNHTPLSNFKIAEEEKIMYNNGQRFMAHNGWVMGGNSTEDFASATSQVYLKRELIAWGDCIKLRYGSHKGEVKYLWDYMSKYVKAQAKVFHGFRIDNCHSTPLHVAEAMLEEARSVRPDIFVMAELFTSSEETDTMYVKRLGLSCLIRESMSAGNSRELGRQLYRYGGIPMGAFYTKSGEPLRPCFARAIFYDQTHDNESPIKARSAYDLPATAAILNMANCATGSSRGYDEFVPHHINVVTEKRLYQLDVDENSGMLPLRRMLNGQLQRELAGFSEIFVDQVNEDVIAITRHNPVDGRSIVLVARTAFSQQPGPCPMRALSIEGSISRILFESQACGDPCKYEPSDTFINGLSSFKTKIFNTNATPSESKLAKLVQLSSDRAEIQLNEFQFLPSSVLAVEIKLSKEQDAALEFLNRWTVDMKIYDVTMSDVNYILFRCSNEDNFEPYQVPGMSKFTYSGLYGLMYYLDTVRENQDQAHPLTQNLRLGGWLGDYIVLRLRQRPRTESIAQHLEAAYKHIGCLPRGMVPKYFDLITNKFYTAILEHMYSKMSAFINKGDRLIKTLALSSVALIGECQSAPMPLCETKLPYIPSIAAGLPHFASGYMRNWGRDTFIAFRGLLLITGRFVEAKAILLSYASTLKHGLIPNLLDGGSNSRYNCRDAVWWWLYSIKEYCKMAPSGNEILKCKLKRLHKAGQPLRKKSAGQTNGVVDSQLADVMQDALECHFRGMTFVEENAGKKLDEHMKEEGFTVTYGVSRETGFVFGGNRFNCGTWMDKMGSSEKAGTKGLPATPRDGSAIEIVGLSKAVISWLDDCRAYPFDGVECLYDNTISIKWTWKKWADTIKANFEKLFFIEPDTASPDPHPELINRRGIYKDTVGASLNWQDYQLRPNFLVAMVVAPELFNPEHAKHALNIAKEQLCGPLGMKTLDPSDWDYCGDYDNANDGTDKKVAHGYNYHQGPEWLWLTGYYVRAAARFLGEKDERSERLYNQLMSTPWLGLPELTNSNGKFCDHSCPIQAWSLGTAIEALHDPLCS